MRTEISTINGITVHNVIYEESDFRSIPEKTDILNICYLCEKFDNNTCLECSCLIEAIIGPKQNRCPLNKW